MSRARLRLAGAISFTSQLLGYLVGILFTAMVSRRLSEREFGAWAFIGTLLSYAVTPTDLFSTWVYRDAARGRKILGHVLLVNTPILTSASLLYIAFSSQAAASAGLQTSLVLLGLIALPPLYLTTAITDIAKGYVPQHVGISSIIFETSKLVFGILLVAQLRLGLQGIFTTLAIAYTLQLTYLLARIKPLASRQIDHTTIKRWMRGSIFKLMSVASGYISQLDIILMTTITATTLITGYWQAALIIALMVKSTGDLMGGLTQRLLAGGGQQDIDKSFTFTMRLAVPALIGAVILSRDILYAFRPTYAVAWPTAAVLAISSFIVILANFYSATIFASDRFDIKEDISFRDFAQSRVFQLWKIGLYTTAAYAALIAVALLYLKTQKTEVLAMLNTASAAHLTINAVRLITYKRLSEKYSLYEPRLKAALPYIAASAIMAIVLLLARIWIDPQAPTLAETLPSLFFLTAIGAITYFAALWSISQDFRDLLNDAKAFIKSRIRI